MKSEMTLLNLIRQKKSEMSKGQKRIADYLLNNYEKAAFLTAMELGKEAGVSESTVVRFASLFGISGYPEFQKKLQELIKDRLHSIDRIDIESCDIAQEEILDKVMLSDAEKIRISLAEIDRKAFSIAVYDILKARNVYVIGIRSCAALAIHLSYYLRMIRSNIIEITSTDVNEIFERMLNVNKEDVVIGISFPRYSMRTLKAMEFANNRNAHMIAITDSKHSPMNMYSSCNLFARSDMASIVESFVAPMSLINALIVALCLKNNKNIIHNLEALDKIIMDYQFSGDDEINLLEEDVLTQLKKLS